MKRIKLPRRETPELLEYEAAYKRGMEKQTMKQHKAKKKLNDPNTSTR